MNTIKIIKIGGNIIDNEKKLDQFLKDFSDLKGDKILIHGGGKIATELGETLGIRAQMIDGKRVTDAETLKIVTMVYAGLINKNIVAKLQSLHCNAIGLTGADANIIPATKRKDSNVDWGFVGDVESSKLKLQNLKVLLDNGMVPVFCALTHDGEGNLLNTNADTIASSIASALAISGKEVSLVYCFEKKGVLTDVNDDNSVIKQINLTYYNQLKMNGIVNKGMIPKLDNAFRSIAEGVKEVKICMAEDLNDFQNAGSTISK
ncbi:MAG: acetylglutamate kinase [Cytophagales bacterium]